MDDDGRTTNGLFLLAGISYCNPPAFFALDWLRFIFTNGCFTRHNPLFSQLMPIRRQEKITRRLTKCWQLRIRKINFQNESNHGSVRVELNNKRWSERWSGKKISDANKREIRDGYVSGNKKYLFLWKKFKLFVMISPATDSGKESLDEISSPIRTGPLHFKAFLLALNEVSSKIQILRETSLKFYRSRGDHMKKCHHIVRSVIYSKVQ